MATYKSYYNEYEKNNLSAVQKRIAEQQNKNTAMSNRYVADRNAIVDKNISNSVNKVQGEIDKLPTAYQASFDANAIQQKINERQVAERMANMGLTNSGLNRTQQTAINIQRSNADAALRQQMNAATASLKQQIADLYASGESQKADIASKARYELEQKNQSVYDTGMTNFYSAADSYANQRLENDALIEKARIEAAAKAEEARIKAEQAQREKYEKWALENGYGYDKNGNLVYTGKVKNSDGEYVYIDDAESLNEGSGTSRSGGTYTLKSNSDYNDAYDYAILNGVPENVAAGKLMKRSEWARSKKHGSTYEEYVDWFVSNYGNSKTTNLLPYASKLFTLK